VVSMCFMLLWLQDFDIEERFQVEFVLLDVAAFNRNGTVVDDLQVTDFEIKENGKSVDVGVFEILDLRANATATDTGEDEASHSAETQPRQQIIVAFDLESAKPGDIQIAYRQIDAFLAQLEQRASLELMLYDLESGELTEGFTDSIKPARDVLAERVARYQDRRKEGVRSFSRAEQVNRGGLLLARQPDLSDLEKALERCSDYRQEATRCIASSLDDYLDFHQQRAKRVIGQLESLVYHFEDAEPDAATLKTVFFISPGFSAYSSNAAERLAELYVQSAGAPKHVIAGADYNMKAEFRRIIHACVRQRVMFHAFDIFNGGLAYRRAVTGRRRQVASSSIRQVYDLYQKDIVGGLTSLAEETGGEFHLLEDMVPEMTRAMDEQSFFYVIGYQSPSGKPGKFRKIKIKCKRRGVKLNYRRGYVGME